MSRFSIPSRYCILSFSTCLTHGLSSSIHLKTPLLMSALSADVMGDGSEDRRGGGGGGGAAVTIVAHC